tara:strand:- start:9 stop:461 length:453 start_codon:yes stop_codon:yes gene_type:complete
MPYKDNKCYENIRCHRINCWKKRGVRFEDKLHINMIYNRYDTSTNCEICDIEYKNSRDRHLDHNHETGEIRNIVCQNCNHCRNNKKGNVNEKYINKRFRKDRNKYYYYVELSKKGIRFRNKFNTLEKAIEWRNKILNTNDLFIEDPLQFN